MTDTVTPTEPQEPLQLSADIQPDGTSEANVKVTWCAPGAELQELVNHHEILKPFVLISVRPYSVSQRDGEERRLYSNVTKQYIVPFSEGQQYVSCSRAGSNAISATVIWSREGHGAWRLGDVFAPGIVFSDYSDELRHERYFDHNGREGYLLYEVFDEITVEVPQEMFAKPLPQWFTDYTGKFMDGSAFDQCKGRARAIFLLFGWSWVYFPVAYLLRALQVVFGLVLGLRDLQYRSFAHPLRYRIRHVSEQADNSIWWFDKEGRALPAWRWPLNPVTPPLLALLVMAISSWQVTEGEREVHWLGWSWWECLGVSLLLHLVPIIAIGLAAGLALVFGAVSGIPVFGTLSKRIIQGRRERRTTRAQRDEKKRREQLQHTRAVVEQLSCSRPGGPARKKTFRMVFQETKHRVCKPYAR